MKAGIKKQLCILSLGLLSVAACSTTKQPPASQMAFAQAALEKASSAGAYEYAPLELKMARDKIDQAKTAIHSKDYAIAERLLEQAAVDAELAEAKAKTVKSQKVVDELQNSINLLREEIQRKVP